MGVLSHLLIADASEAGAVAASNEPALRWDGSFCRGLEQIKLVMLWALVETGAPDDRFDSRLDEVQTLPKGNEGPWVDVIPPKMLATLASIAAMEENEQESLAKLWGGTKEFDGWEASEILDLVRDIGDSAESAQLGNKTLLIWTSM
jgi:hypothetical protein